MPNFDMVLAHLNQLGECSKSSACAARRLMETCADPASAALLTKILCAACDAQDEIEMISAALAPDTLTEHEAGMLHLAVLDAPPPIIPVNS